MGLKEILASGVGGRSMGEGVALVSSGARPPCGHLPGGLRSTPTKPSPILPPPNFLLGSLQQSAAPLLGAGLSSPSCDRSRGDTVASTATNSQGPLPNSLTLSRALSLLLCDGGTASKQRPGLTAAGRADS